VKNKLVIIYKLEFINDKEVYKDEIFRTEYQNIFIGSDKGKNKGNSILVNIKNATYLFIGMDIYKFTVKEDEIIKFYSPIGNNDVPYPYAKGKKNTYLFIDKVFINNNYLQINENPYDNYYKAHLLKIAVMNEKRNGTSLKTKIKNMMDELVIAKKIQSVYQKMKTKHICSAI
jgi:hypothetical protein